MNVTDWLLDSDPAIRWQVMRDLTDAAIQRRTLEKLEERHATARKHADEKADEKAVDDLTTAAASRLGSGLGSR